MSHRAQQVIDAVAAALATVPAAVYTHRRFSLSEADQELPAVSVDYGADEPTSEFGVSNLAYIDSLLEVRVTIAVRDLDESAVLTQLLDLRRDVHVALMADRTFGLAFVIDTRYGGAAEPVVDVSLDEPAGLLTTSWLVHYRMNYADPET